MTHGASAEGERTTAYDICYCYGFELRRPLSADLRDWQALRARKIPGRTDERKPLVDEERATLFHVLPLCTFAQIQDSEDSVTVYGSLFWSDFKGCLFFELIEFVSAQA